MPRILVVDDEPDICQMIRRYAEHDGNDTVGVSDGTEAVAVCRKEDFDIIIMDVMMPDMDGFAACRKIKEQKDIPVLMLSARGKECILSFYPWCPERSLSDIHTQNCRTEKMQGNRILSLSRV